MIKGSLNLVSILSIITMAAVGVEITTHLEDLEAYLEVNRKRQLRLPPLQRLQLPQGEQLQQHQVHYFLHFLYVLGFLEKRYKDNQKCAYKVQSS